MDICGKDFYQELRGWQTAIGSLLGFIALMVGALWNFHLDRRRDAALRREEAVAVAAALYGEIVLLRKEAARLARAAAYIHLNQNKIIKFDDHFLEAYNLSDPILYKALSSKIVILRADLLIAITEFHKKFQEARTSMPLLLGRPGRGYSYNVSTVLSPLVDAVTKIMPTLRKIEKMAHIVEPTAETLDLGEAETVLDMEEDH